MQEASRKILFSYNFILNANKMEKRTHLRNKYLFSTRILITLANTDGALTACTASFGSSNCVSSFNPHPAEWYCSYLHFTVGDGQGMGSWYVVVGCLFGVWL